MYLTHLGADTLPTDIRICSRCIYDERVPAITFDEDGVCNYCHQVDGLIEQYGTGLPKGEELLAGIIDTIKREGRNKRYDCVIGVSGGTDSSYMLYLAKKVWGLRPLAVHYDNTWNTAISTQNIRLMLSQLDIDLYTHVVNNKEADDIFRSFFLAGVAELDASTDLAFAEVLQSVAYKFGIGTILEGHTFVNEGITPLGKNYFDGKYVQEVHRRFGTKKMETYPLMTFNRMLFWSAIARIKKIRPYWYMSYSKEEAQDFLQKEFGWQYYGGHHLENRMAAFCHGVYFPGKFGADLRNNTLSALARQGKITREEAWRTYCQPPHIEPELIAYFQKRLGLSDNQYKSVMADPPHYWYEYPTYKKRFERFRPLFKLLADANLVTRSFYLKYCFPGPETSA